MTRKRCHNDKLFTSKTTQGVSFLTCLPSHCGEGQRCHLAHPTPALCQISGTKGVLNIQEMNFFFFLKTKHSFALFLGSKINLSFTLHLLPPPNLAPRQNGLLRPTCP